MKSRLHFPHFLPILSVFATVPACIIAADDDDSAQDTFATTGDDTQTPTTSATGTTTTTGATGDETSGGLPSCEADDNAIADPGFEGGADNDAWSAGSEQFASPICDASCVTSGAAGPAAGQWWVWFGGDQENEENAYVSQDVVIPSDGDGTLRFMFAINGAGELDASDTFDVSIDGANVFAASGANMGDYPDYTLVTVDVGDFADDASHTLRFDAHFEPGGLTSFFLDEVYMCGTPAAGTTGSTGDESGTSGTDGTTGATGTDTDTDTDTEGTTAGTTDESGSTGTTGGTTAAT